jgi:hypothetical protein
MYKRSGLATSRPQCELGSAKGEYGEGPILYEDTAAQVDLLEGDSTGPTYADCGVLKDVARSGQR